MSREKFADIASLHNSGQAFSGWLSVPAKDIAVPYRCPSYYCL